MDNLMVQLDNPLWNHPRYQETNPLIKFLLILIIALFYFAITDIVKIYCLLIIVLLYYNFHTFPYQVSKPKYRFLIIFSLLIFFVQILSNQRGNIAFYLLPRLPIYEEGLYFGILLIGRFWGIISISWVFIDSTNPFGFANSLISLKIPYRLAYSLSLALRFTPVLNNELNIIKNAQQTRGLNTSPKSIKGAYNLLRYTLFPLISSTLNRIQYITISMDGRAFGLYQSRTTVIESPLQLSDIGKFILTIFCVGCFYLI
jgi:energy-coupling factor transport system permease protein